MTTATLAGTNAIVRLERTLTHPPDVVWRALTNHDELLRWFPCEVVVEKWEVGAPMTFIFHEHDIEPMSGVVLEVDPPRELAFTWGEETLRMSLRPHGDGRTILTLTDELARSFAARNAAGWEVCL